MSGTTTLKSQKGLLTRHCNSLRRLLDNFEARPTQTWMELRQPLDMGNTQELVFAIQSTLDLVLTALSAFTATVDSMGEKLDEEHEKQVDEYIDTAQTLIDRASAVVTQTEARVRTARDHTWTEETNREPLPGTIQPARPELPAIPIPSFSGKVWEYKNFWTLFCANVHNQPLTRLQKFNYLLTSLRGEARELIKRCAVTEENYDLAVELMHKKYGNTSTLIDHLQTRLEEAKAENTSTQSQRRLLETIIPIVAQLEQEGVNLDGSYLTRKVLAKFTVSIQRKILGMRLSPEFNEIDWKMQDLLRDLDQHLTMEERIDDMVKARNVNISAKYSSKDSSALHHKTPQCMFCLSPYHKSLSCLQYPTTSERRTVMQERKLCLNCGKPGHYATQCKSQGCRNCNGTRHHHTLCPQLMKKKDEPNPKHWTPGKRTEPVHATKEPKIRNERIKQGKPTETRANPVSSDQISDQDTTLTQKPDLIPKDTEETVVLQSTGRINSKNDCVLLLTGSARLWNTNKRRWEIVEILFDTGADRSFISEALAQYIGLTYITSQKLRMRTFGTEEPKTALCKLTTVDIWDTKGNKYPVQLYTTPVLTGTGKTAHLTPADQTFIARHSIHLSKVTQGDPSTPQILLGCDQLWNFLESTCPQYTLPSGLRLIPSRLGYLLTGKQLGTREQMEGNRHTDQDSVVMVNSFTNFEEDLQRWDKYWTMDSSGICEFTGTKDAEKKAVNEKVLQFFNDTIEKRDDGYYVRFPYKENHAPLPSNRTIALKRLHSVLNMLRSRPDILKDYEKTIVTQKEKGIIEEVPNDRHHEGPVLHYIPHQPVITPQKETTKLRIVFDASSHFTDCPSLNDILHQGPLILPELHEMLLRFRIPPYVVIADVEKAFLQVRLHELDRDATRFFWVRDTGQPVDEDNLVTYRFTRVTFGLNVSPFLLAGTIQHHLRSVVQDDAIAEEIRENLYVDNLILAADSTQETHQKAIKSRQVFAEMGMNLREFLSNDLSLSKELPEDACARGTTQKVLGITWNAKSDTLTIRCHLPISERLTKRVVARRIASIYDPLGWLVPLLTQAKRFQQNLWKLKYEWDSELPQQLKQEWQTITENADGFLRSFNRQFLSNTEECDLAVFSDASDTAISCCAYLFNEKSSTLTMAKCKLPSIHSKTTMPKLEMNALTLGTRLARSILHAIKNRFPKRPIRIFLFSDSQIALTWLKFSDSKGHLGRLVENRLKEIREIVKSLKEQEVSVEFRHIPSTDNPADAGTRGLTKDQLNNHSWWVGPKFLRTPINQWSSPVYDLAQPYSSSTSDLCYVPTVSDDVMIIATQATQENVTPLLDLNRFSSLRKAKRVTAMVLIFIKKLIRALPTTRFEAVLRNIPSFTDIPDNSIILDGAAIHASRMVLLRNHQSTFLTRNYRRSMDNTLRPYLDKENLIWRSQGRLGNTNLKEEGKYPVIVAPNTPLAELIIKDAHGRYHQGIDHTMATIRSQYWIPKLRQQVRKVVSRCVQCRRFNALPYPYPESTDLPERRVVRSRPFQHVGLDFFDLPQVATTSEVLKPSGCIFTCTVTRLLHLELVQSMSTEDFINALRRFVARRGLPDSITCDNAPTFLLSARILSEKHQVHEDILNATSDKEIQWRHITPYAPWQGGFYERLIKSIKHALYKSIRGTNQRSIEDLRTSLAEIEACLNSRPLTYLGDKPEEFTVVRPIDFIQKDINITLPLNCLSPISRDDPDYHTPAEIRELRTRDNVIEALQSSCKATERFWTIWQEQYLTSLREKHKMSVTNRRCGKEKPAVGDVVLINDPILPRNDWKLGRVTNMRYGHDGNVREVELITATKRTIRRPVNLLVPMEIHTTEHVENALPVDLSRSEEVPTQTPVPHHRYNLRKRPSTKPQPVNVTVAHSPGSRVKAKWFLFHLMLLSWLHISLASIIRDITIDCTEKGLLISTKTGNKTIEICAEHYCQRFNVTEIPGLIRIPPDITIHDHLVLIKWNVKGKLTTIETRCPGIDFCENIDCWFCTPVLLNPECRPIQALSIVMVLLYGTVATLYTLLYVPMTIGKPIRLLLQGVKLVIAFFARNMGRCTLKVLRRLLGRRYRSQRDRIMAALAIVTCFAALSPSTVRACQHVNILEHNSTICTSGERGETCQIRLMELLKLNSFTQEACLRVTHKTSLIANIKVRWKGLYLRCDQETLYFTRPTVLKTLDSKRCPKMGSCGEEKCANFNTSTLVEELAPANSFPGRTGCIESCGGWGCDCFYLSSGCLFYRVFAVPISPNVYEVFRCTRWTEELKMEVMVEDFHSPTGKKRYVLAFTPNVPVEIPSVRLTVTTLTLPPTPSLNNKFITNGEETAIWEQQSPPNLVCATRQQASSLNCSVVEDCRCTPAENRANCICSTIDVEEEFNRVELKLPVKTAAWELKRQTNSMLIAKIPQMVSADVILEFLETVDTTALTVENNTCLIANSALQGCYKCSKGAHAKVRCHSHSETLGEVVCDNHAFVVPCSPKSPVTTLHFHLDSARQLLNCSIKCGSKTGKFTLSGILKYTTNIHTHMSAFIQGNSTVYHEIAWPDFNHIISVFLSWYKMVLFGFLLVVAILLLTYVFIQSLGMKFLRLLAHAIIMFALCPVKILIFVLKNANMKKEAGIRRTNDHEKNH